MRRCPVCSARTSLTPTRRVLRKHRRGDGAVCSASGHRPELLVDSPEPRTKHKLSRWAKISAYVVFTVIAGTLGILGWFGIGPGSPSPSPSDSGTVEVNPYLYVAGEGSHLPRKQDCDGLLGFCLGQPLSLATEAFGTTEADGFPQSGGETEGGLPLTCHRWQTARIDTVDVCAAQKAIESISIVSLGISKLTVATPNEGIVEFAAPSDFAAERMTELLGRPFRSAYLQGEGEAVYAYDWFFPAATEGGPTSKISLVGRVGSFPQPPPPRCPGEELQTPYRLVVKLSAKAPVTSVTVARVTSRDLDVGSPC